jgi:hypothetical protein
MAQNASSKLRVFGEEVRIRLLLKAEEVVVIERGRVR